jgi:hypothetical protein
MANEFKVRNGLIVTGSEYVSESIFAPNLPPETNPAYYITWRQSDGRFEVSQLSPANTANTIGCWDAVTSGDPTAGEWRTNDGSVGSSTTEVWINVVDNAANNQNNTLASLAVGSVITLYVGSNSTSFEITGIKIFYSSPGVPLYYRYNVNFLSGDQYTYLLGATMCLGIAAAAPTNQNCVTYKAVTSKSLIDSTTGGGMFINNSGGVGTWSLTTNSTTEYINVNQTDLNGVVTQNFFGGVALGQTITLASGTNSATYTVSYVGGSGTNYLIGVKMTSNSNFTLTSGTSFTICI